MLTFKKGDRVRVKATRDSYSKRIGTVETRKGDFVAVNLRDLPGLPVCFRADELELAPAAPQEKP